MGVFIVNFNPGEIVAKKSHRNQKIYVVLSLSKDDKIFPKDNSADDSVSAGTKSASAEAHAYRPEAHFALGEAGRFG